MKQLPAWFLLGFLLLLGSCTEVEDTYQPVSSNQYYPLQVGNSWTYAVDSIVFRPELVVEVDSVHLFLREEVVDTILDNNGYPWFEIEQFERYAIGEPWIYKQTLTATIQDAQALRVENNLRFIKLVFPVATFQQWDGNVFFDPATIVRVGGETIEMFKDWDYQTTEIDGQFLFQNNQPIDSTITVVNADSENLIELRRVTERYSPGIGLVYRELEILDTQDLDPTKGWRDKAEKGFILRQTLIDYQ